MTAAAAAEKKKKRDEMYYKFNTSRGMGYWKTRLRHYEDAVNLFSTAIENVEANTGLELPLIIARSKGYSRLVNHEAARRDALGALQNQPENLRALENDAFTLYEKDDFEDSLVRNYCGLRKRKKPDQFYNGILMGKETIEDTVGRNAGPCLDHDRLGHIIVDMYVKPKWFTVDIDELTQAKNKFERERIDRFFAQKYLGRLANDKQFLLDFLKLPDLKSRNTESNRQLEELISGMIKTINREQETLMTQRPMYMLKHNEPKFSQRYLVKKQEDDDRLKNGVMGVINKLMDEASKLQQAHKIEDCLSTLERLRRFLECQPTNLLSDRNKERLLNQLYQITGLLFMDTKTFVESWSESDNDRRIQFILRSYIDDPRFIDRCRQTYFPPIWNVKEMKRNIKARLSVSIHSVERAYLYHELSRCLFEEGSVEKAYKAASVGYKAVKESKNILWCFNLGFLTALAVLMEGNTDDAKIAFKETNVNAKKLDRNDCAAFMQRVMKISSEPFQLEYVPKNSLVLREKQIVNMMPTADLKVKAHTVLQKVASAPPKARLKLKPTTQYKTVTQAASRRSMRMNTMAKRRTLYEVKSSRLTQVHQMSFDKLGDFDCAVDD